jgi:hypothetical protein
MVAMSGRLAKRANGFASIKNAGTQNRSARPGRSHGGLWFARLGRGSVHPVRDHRTIKPHGVATAQNLFTIYHSGHAKNRSKMPKMHKLDLLRMICKALNANK